MAENKPNNYIDNKRFLAAIIDHKAKIKKAKEEGKPEPKLSDYIGLCLLQIAERFSSKYNFSGYSWREEMVSDALENMVLYFDKFDPERYDNPFAYFTQITYNAFIRRIQKEEKQRYIRYKFFQESVMSPDVDDSDVFGDTNTQQSKQKFYDTMNDLMESFEKKEEIKKEKRRIFSENKKKENKENGFE
jgi:DNA-directed RNA polymerase specialized sigma24 family protein